ncbi:hypothetical protein FV226_08090 [Methylobacterium sp. WL12]|uniref:hypothetical protein n=1 Tax=Methylobacterium sp. WL12 TaxID=2603890 RepID=UPI0011C6FC9B|nr:hypothetical protein [Methylobacterium sp. WL12]TXM73765.1 hypothetical protein FV226_08090 [Methylobacterium sp. WL12]
MSQHATRIAGDLSLDVARHGALLGTALQYGLHQRRRHIEAHRRAGVDAVTDLAARLQEARASEDEAWAAASSLSNENARLRETLSVHQAALAEAQDRIARLEQAVLTAAAHLAR